MKTAFFFAALFFVGPAVSANQLSPYGTGFGVGTKEDLQVRMEWAKKDPCYDPGFSKTSMEYIEVKKYRAVQSGPSGKPPECPNKKPAGQTR
jgi:hypothetical protein